jgi:hypothetical protein
LLSVKGLIEILYRGGGVGVRVEVGGGDGDRDGGRMRWAESGNVSGRWMWRDWYRVIKDCGGFIVSGYIIMVPPSTYEFGNIINIISTV